MRQRRSVPWLLIFGVWALPGVYYAIQVYLERSFENQPITFAQALLRGLVFWLLWAVSSPLVFWLARTFPIPRREWLDGLLFHLPAGLIFSLSHLLLYVFFTSWLSRGFPPASFTSLLAEFQPVFISSFAWWSLVYWTILIASYAFDYYRQYQAGALKSSQLEAQLAQAQLHALKMQIHPHFLFNTLHSISALMREDVESADQMIARLGDFLRLTLHNTGEQETSLDQELKFLLCYLEIEQLRFRDRLVTKIEVDPATSKASVPNLLLQPIVENAIRHGISRQSGPGLITIRARRVKDRLQIEIQDNGPGMRLGDPASDQIESHGRSGNGLGLANTRARLLQLYGADYRFELKSPNGPGGGGLLVVLEIPFSEKAPQPLQVA